MTKPARPYSHYGIFEELDGEYYEASESDMQAVAEYIENEWPKFADLPE